MEKALFLNMLIGMVKLQTWLPFQLQQLKLKSKNTEIKGVFTYGRHLLFLQLLTIIFHMPTLQNFLHIMSRPLHH